MTVQELFDLNNILEKQAPDFIEKLLAKLHQVGLGVVDELELDHICYRVETEEQYKSLFSQFMQVAELLVEDSINGRLISTFKLNKPVQGGNRSVYLIELPMPKDGSPYILGFEHGEFVVGIETDLVEFSKRYPSITWDLSALKKELNSDVRVELDSSFESKMSAKFHHLPLDKVIQIEKAAKYKS